MKIKEFNIREFGACGDGVTEDTAAIQSAVDAAAKTGGKVIVPPGNYLTGSLFLKSGIEFHLEKEAVLLGIQDESAYPAVDVYKRQGKWHPPCLQSGFRAGDCLCGGRLR